MLRARRRHAASPKGSVVKSFENVLAAQRLLFGAGAAVEHVATAVRDLGGDRVLLIAGGSAAQLADRIAEAVPVVDRVEEVVRHVPAPAADAAATRARESRADVVVSVGGGSATGLAKIVALRTGLPIIAVPTTFAGSEATVVWGITQDGVKTTGSNPVVLPRVVVYDATLTAGLPAAGAAASGLNALAHALDALWAPRANPINAAFADEGARAVLGSLRRLADGDAGLETHEELLAGTYLASLAFSSSGSGMHHKICHVLGGAFDLPHAELHAVVLPYVVAFNAPAAAHVAVRLERLLGPHPGAALQSLARALGIPRSLAEIGFPPGEVARAAELCLTAIPVDNPRPVTVDALAELLAAAARGDDIPPRASEETTA